MDELLPQGLHTPGSDLYTFFNGLNAVIGYGWCLDKGNSTQLIAYFAVKPEYQRQGYATQMMNFICDQAKESAIEKIVLGVEKDNVGAITLYQKSGFSVVGEEDIRYVMLKEMAISQ